MLYEELLTVDPTHSLSLVLDDTADEFMDAFEAFWGLNANQPPESVSEAEWRSLVDLHRLAQKFAIGASSLVRPRRIREDQLTLPELLDEEASKRRASTREMLAKIKDQVSDDIWWAIYDVMQPDRPDDPRIQKAVLNNFMAFEAHRMFGSDPNQMAARMLKLLRTMIRHPGEFTRTYLERVAECYIRGMLTELAVMARVAMDLALQEVVKDEHVRDSVGAGKHVELERRIQAARSMKLGVFGEEDYAAANRLRKAGNAAAHGSLEDIEEISADYDADAVVEDLAVVLRKIESVKERR